MKKNGYNRYFSSVILPAVIFGAVTGALTGAVVTVYKFCAGRVIHAAEMGYAALRTSLWWVFPLVLVLGGVAAAVACVYKRVPSLRGGGIPTSIAALRGTIPFRPIINLLGTFFLSLVTFLIGVPLGNEGPAVQIGTALGKGCVSAAPKKQKAWDRFSMTGGACAGFATATGAPVSGILFAVEEAHGRLSPLLIIFAAVSVLAARVVSSVLCPLLGVEEALLGTFTVPSLAVRELWIPLAVGVAMGVFAVLFLRFYRLLHRLFNTHLKLPPRYKLLIVYALTVAGGLCSFSFISTGHHLIETLFTDVTPLFMLVLLLIVRTVLTLSANCNGLTGGLFLPIMALGALFAAILGKGCMALGMDPAFYTVFLLLGITACVSGMMKTPLIAVVFSIEALSLGGNVLAVVIAAVSSFVITEMCNAESITDYVSELRAAEIHAGKESCTVETAVTVAEGAFAVGKQVRDILWPDNLFVLSQQHTDSDPQADVHGGKTIRAGDRLEVRYTTVDQQATMAALNDIVGG